MPIISVYKCPVTGKLFENKSKYIKHLRDLGNHNRIQRQKEVYRNKWQALITELNSLHDSAHIAKWIEDHSKDLLMNGMNHYHINTRVPKCINDFKIKVTNFDLKYNPMVSCSHSAPRGCKTNWGGKTEHGPTHYPAFVAHMEFGFSHDTPCFFSDVFGDTGICTGSGSSWHNFEHNGIKYKGLHSYVTLWADDWPGLKVHHHLTQE